MNSFNNKMLIYLSFGMTLLFAMTMYAAESNKQTASGKAKIQAPVGRTGRPPSPSDVAYRNRKAVQKYEQRNADITPWVEEAMQVSPGNAALLYYQAFLLRPEPNEAIDAKLREVLGSVEPDRRIKIYLSKCLPAIEILEIASRIPQCTWGVWPKQIDSQATLHGELSTLTQILVVDAKTLAVDGHYHAALEKCLTIRRFARHLSEDPKLYLYSKGRERLALRTIQYVLGVMPLDEDILTWFRGQLAVVEGAPPLFSKRLQETLKRFNYPDPNASSY